MRDGKVVKTMTKPTTASTFRMMLDPRSLAPKGSKFVFRGGKAVAVKASKLYTLTARVTLKAPGSFLQNKTVRTKTLTTGSGGRKVAFRAVASCALPAATSG